jgi:hypothetical protein
MECLRSGNWRNFCESHDKERNQLSSRQDGAATSSELGFLFDADEFIVSRQDIRQICMAVLNKDISLSLGFFVFNIVALCGFNFDDEVTENTLMFLASPEGLASQSSLEDALQELR